MPTFDFTSPDGKSYSVDGPDGATPEQAFKILQQHLGAPSDAGSSSLGGVAKSLGTGLAQGALGLAGLPADIAHLYATNPNDPNPLGSEGLQKKVEQYTGDFYKPQGAAEDIASKIGQFAPAMIGGPESLAVKAATRVLAPAVASEAAGKATEGTALQPYAEAAGALAGGVGASAALNKFKALAAARQAANAVPSADDLLKMGSNQFEAARNMNLMVKPDFATNAAADMRVALKGFDPEAQANVFKAADRLAGLGSRVTSSVPVAAQEVATVAEPKVIKPRPSPTAAPAQPSLLQFLALKGGLGPDAELAAIGGEGHTVNVEGVGRRRLVRQGGLPLDYAREAAQEAGYLSGTHTGTSTVNDLLDAIDAEIRGQKLYPQGFEGTIGKREAVAMSERERHDFERHMQGFEDDLSAAGHGQLGSDVKERAIQLMANNGMNADTAVENALHQLEQQDNAVHVASFPGDSAFSSRSVGNVPVVAPVPMNDIENIRKQLTSLKMSPDGATREAARTAIKSLQKSQMELAPEHVISGDAGRYTKLIRDATGNWAAGKRSNTVMGKVALGNLNAETAGSGANVDNALRQAIKQLVRPVNNDIVPKAQRLGFNAAEIAAMNTAARGTVTGNIARLLGKGAPTGIVSAAGGLGVGHMAGGPIGAVAVPVAGYIAKKIGDLSTKRAVSAVDKLVRSRSPLASQVIPQLPPQVINLLPAKSQRILQGLIASDRIAAQQSNPIGQTNAY